VAILTGAGGNFCSGMDLKAFVRGEAIRVDGRGLLGLVYTPPQKPIIAAVEGYALAGGFESALACDMIVAANNARFGLPEVKRGLVAAAGGLVRLPRSIPSRIAMEMVLTGDFYDASYLQSFGLINQLVEPGEALEASVKLAQRIVPNAPRSVRVSKEVVNGQRSWTDEESFIRQNQIVGDLLSSADAKEGATAFAEKRKPRWQGR